MNLKAVRTKLRLSQDELGKLARVRRVNILSHEKGYRKLTPKEHERVRLACLKEAENVVVSAAAAKRLCTIRVKPEAKAKTQHPVKTKATKAA